MAEAPVSTHRKRLRTRPPDGPQGCRAPGPIAERLLELTDAFARSQRQLVVSAAEFADSTEWVLAGWPNAAR